jgi:hypothetical protein
MEQGIFTARHGRRQPRRHSSRCHAMACHGETRTVKERPREMVRHGAGGRRPAGARRALRAPGRCRPGARQKPGRARAPRLPLAGPPRARVRPCGAYACMACICHGPRRTMPCVCPKCPSSARKRNDAAAAAAAASGHRAARRGTAQHRLANNAGRRTGAASPALASDTSLLHRRWHCQTQHAAHGYTTKQASKARFQTSKCVHMHASIWICLHLLMIVVWYAK